MAKHIAWLTQALFFISIASGFVVLFAYYPNSAYESVQKIHYIIPYGYFFRSLHYFSSEAFFVVLLLHIAVELYKKEIKISRTSWSYSIVALLMVALLMFTGFVLKADQSANAAAQVALSLLKETPFLDSLIPLLQDSSLFYWKFFLWHIIFLPLMLTYAIYRHIKKIIAPIEYVTIALAISLLLPLLFVMPKDIALEIEAEHLLGPWFFWGAENLLALGFSPLIVNLSLILPFVLLFAIRHYKNNLFLKIALTGWLIAYAALSF
jgi:ubiquinol-cytochrome c reductase cytochrome b subunit